MPQFNIPDEVKEILKIFEGENFEIYIVGGAVRDLLMGKIPSDWDFTTNANPEKILEILGEDAFYDNKFGTVGLPSKENLDPFEITTYRTESGYEDARHPTNVKWGKSLDEDLERRDFTINAMALNKNLEVIDPYKGHIDLDKKIIKAVGNPTERFTEDALRMMRAVRIAAQLNFRIEEKTFEAIISNSILITKISKERIKEELFKIISSNHPSEGILMLKDSGLLEIILPEVYKMFGVEQKSPGRHHIYDVGTHCLMALKFCDSNDPIVRFATLIHDIGKPQTMKKLATGTITFYNHEVVGTFIAERIADRLKFSKHEKEKLLKLVRWHQFTVNEFQTDAAIRRFIKHVGAENLDDMLILRTADRLGSGSKETSWRTEDFKKKLIEIQKEPFAIKDLKINGSDVMKELNLKPGPEVGKILEELFKEVVEKKIENTKENLLNQIRLKSNSLK
ncbi:HD domain-containing protein [soil metagenome]